MAGGIQKGTTPISEESDKMDKQVRRCSKDILAELQLKYDDLIRLHKLPKACLFEGIGACQPDGGAWFYLDHLLAAFEGKFQGPTGNAIERWFKNFFHIVENNPRCPLVTWAAGPGVRPEGPIYKTLYRPVRGEYNVLRDDGPSVFLREEGFSDEEIKKTMIEFIEHEMEKVLA